ncbi:MAG: hypothetical protein KGL39_53115 [Patescibacteria group bacterium]|nr:hypothetical protein [Patescibacteria group bacterium]
MDTEQQKTLESCENPSDSETSPPWRNGRRFGLKIRIPTAAKNLNTSTCNGNSKSESAPRSAQATDSPCRTPEGSSEADSEPDLRSSKDLGSVHRHLVTCTVCGKPFFVKRVRADRTHRHCCSRHCLAALANQAERFFSTPPSTKTERIRANGLINMRIRRGVMQRPANCQRCGKPCRPDAHHPDYNEPDLVAFLCRSCHAKTHMHPEIEKEVAAIARRPSRQLLGIGGGA